MKLERSTIDRVVIIVTGQAELETAATYCWKNGFRLVSATAISRKYFEVIAERFVSMEREELRR